MTAPTTLSQLHRLLRERMDGFAPGQQRIARLLLADAEGCAFRTISEFAQQAQVHESSIVRFANALGLGGYRDLVELSRQQVREQAQLVQRFDRASASGESANDLILTVSDSDQRNIARTFANVDEQVWERTVALLAAAPGVHVIGLRKCFTVAYLLAYLLRLVRPDVRQLGITSGLIVEELRDVRQGDLLVGVSIHRYSSETVTAVEYAATKGVDVVVLTDNPASPLARHSDLCFYVECGGVGILRSLSAFVSLVQALATAAAVRLGANSRSALLLDEQLLTDLQVYACEAVEPSSVTRSGNTQTLKKSP
jgi:DNA-binding MurR/RpiR family transcriptional regulator